MWDSKENYVLAARAGPPCQSGIKTIPLPHADIAHWKDVLINPSLGAHLLCSPLPVPLLVHSSNQRNLIKTEGTHLSRASLSRKKGERKIRRGWRGPLWSLLIRSQGAPPLWPIWSGPHCGVQSPQMLGVDPIVPTATELLFPVPSQGIPGWLMKLWPPSRETPKSAQREHKWLYPVLALKSKDESQLQKCRKEFLSWGRSRCFLWEALHLICKALLKSDSNLPAFSLSLCTQTLSDRFVPHSCRRHPGSYHRTI